MDYGPYNTKNLATENQLKMGVNSGAPEG